MRAPRRSWRARAPPAAWPWVRPPGGRGCAGARELRLPHALRTQAGERCSSECALHAAAALPLSRAHSGGVAARAHGA
jgi:hypothetical protein